MATTILANSKGPDELMQNFAFHQNLLCKKYLPKTKQYNLEIIALTIIIIIEHSLMHLIKCYGNFNCFFLKKTIACGVFVLCFGT